jgi:hypothetical protein
MRIYECIEEPTVQRDMDLTRELLLKIEADERLDGMRWLRYSSPEELGINDHSLDEIGYHLKMLIEANFLTGKTNLMEAMPYIKNITWQGHELLDDIRDDTIWGNTKERAKGLAGVGMSLMWEIAKAELKQRLKLP